MTVENMMIQSQQKLCETTQIKISLLTGGFKIVSAQGCD